MSYFDTTVFNRTAQQQKETNDLLRELIKTLQEQKSKCRYPTQNFEPPMPTQPPEGAVVAYLDVGANGYLDLGSELSEDALQQLPKGRHALVVAGTYGIDGYVATPQPPPTAQAADSVPAVEREQERIAFKDAHRHLELDEVPDAWGRPMFKHSHVEASWLGWIARASRGQSSSQAGEYPPLVCDYCGALTPDPWHSSGMLHGKMSKHIHSCDACAARGAAQAAYSVTAPAPPPECETEAEKRAFAFGWFKALESERMKADNKKKGPL